MYVDACGKSRVRRPRTPNDSVESEAEAGPWQAKCISGVANLHTNIDKINKRIRDHGENIIEVRIKLTNKMKVF